jgi:hypothetical protein
MANIMTPNLSQLALAQALRKRDRPPPRRLPLHPLPVPELGFGVGVAGRPHRRHQRQADDRSGARHAGARSSAWRSRAPSTAAPNVPRCTRIPLARPISSTWPAIAHEDTLLTVEPYDGGAPAPSVRRCRAQRLVHRSPVPRTGDGRRRSGPRGAARVLRRGARTHPGPRHLVAGRLDPGRPCARMAYLSIVDYPGFEGMDAPDMETYSKALNAASTRCRCWPSRARRRALPQGRVRQHHDHQSARDGRCLRGARGPHPGSARNIRERGREFVQQARPAEVRAARLITKVQGTGLLFSCELAPEFKCYGAAPPRNTCASTASA